MRAAERLADFLLAQGVPRVFGIPGSEAIELLEALRQRGIEFVLTHHEASAAHMAAATWQLTGVPGVCVVTRGPGAMNVYPGVAAAHLDRRAIVVISAAHPPDDGVRPAMTHQRLPLVEQFAPITKWAGHLRASDLAETLPHTWECALRPKPGPVFLAFPAEQAEREAPPVPGGVVKPRLQAPGPVRDEVIARLAAARRPLVIAGIGATRSGVPALQTALVERLGCPALVTPQAKGVFPEDHARFAGTFGMYRDEPLQALIDDSDLVLGVGLDGVDLFKRWRSTAPVVALADAGADDPAVAPALASDGDLRLQLRKAIETARPSDWPADAAARAREAIAAMLEPTGPEAPQVAIDALRKALPADGVLIVDVGSHKIVVAQQWRAGGPGTFLCSNGLSPMGTALPFAIGAQLARPEARVACVLGDGGLLMSLGELNTLARLKLPLVLLVMVDDAMTSIRVKQVRKGYPSTGTEFARPDYAALARAFGLDHVLAREDGVFERALASGRPTLVEARIDPTEYDRTQ